MDRHNFRRGSLNTQSACKILHTFITAAFTAAHICEHSVWSASPRLSAPIPLLFFPGSHPGKRIATCLTSNAVLCLEARQSQPRGSVPRWILTCSIPIPCLLRRLCRSSAIVLSQWDEVCRKGYSYSHSSFQTMAFNSAAFSVSESKS